MRGREVGWSAFCAGSGALLVYVLRWAFGGWPSPVVVFGVLLVSLGCGLVMARYSRLGPFAGELGSPWAEHELRDAIVNEASRAARYSRDVSIVAARCDSPADWGGHVRGVDRVIACRHGWMVLLLPETDAHGALALMRRVGAADASLRAAIVTLPEDVLSGDELVAALLDLVRPSTGPGRVLTMRHGQVRAHPLPT